MAYTAPTAADFFEKFPEFDYELQSRVEALIVEANRRVDNYWLEADYATAILYLTAHLLTADIASDASSGVAAGGITSESIGRISVSYAAGASAGASAIDLSSTTYGQRFRDLQRLNVPAVTII